MEEKAFRPENNFSDEFFDFGSFCFPLDNSEANFDMTEMNFNAGGDNSMLFLEFDLMGSNISKDHLRSFREINQEFVDKEIHFVINVNNFILQKINYLF